MSGVSGITSQLNNTNACNNCNDDGLKSRLQKVEADNAQQEAHLTLLDSKIKPDGAPVFGTLEQQLKALQGELSAVKNFADFLSNGLQTKEDKGGLASTEQIAKQALQVANAAYDAVFALDESISVIQSILPIISGKADAGYALAQKAYNLADATSTVTQIHTKEIDNLQIRVQSLEDRVSKLEQNQGDLNNLKDRVGSLENWRTGTVATLILLALQISKLKNRLDNLP